MLLSIETVSINSNSISGKYGLVKDCFENHFFFFEYHLRILYNVAPGKERVDEAQL